jgi:hypothetical protein
MPAYLTCCLMHVQKLIGNIYCVTLFGSVQNAVERLLNSFCTPVLLKRLENRRTDFHETEYILILKIS